jgi:hypothetical protein
LGNDPTLDTADQASDQATGRGHDLRRPRHCVASELVVPASSPPSHSPGQGRFRIHTGGLDVPPERECGGIFVQLSQEWIRLATLPSMPRTLRRWGRAEPPLAGFVSLGDLVDGIDRAQGSAEDELLLALVRLAQSGQQLAGRVVLQAMLPKLACMVRRMRSSSSEDRLIEDRRHIAVATFWEVLNAYPTQRRQARVAGNLALDTLHQLTSGLRKPPADIPLDPQEASERLAVCSYEAPRLRGEGLTADADLLDVIAWGVDVAAITREDASLLVRVYLPDPRDGQGVAGGAEDLGLSHAALRQRCSRARRRLIAAVRAETADGQPGTLAVTAA